jgi:hypothetical protein
MDQFSEIQVSILMVRNSVNQPLHLDLLVALLQEIHQDIVAAAVVAPALLDKVQRLEMVELEKFLQLLALTLVAVELVVLTRLMVESVELAAAETVETVLVVLAVTMESRTLAAAADRWEMPVAVTEH